MLAFAKVQGDIINLNDVKHISIFEDSISVHFLSTGNPVRYHFDSEKDAEDAIDQLWHSMKLLQVAK